MKDYDRQIHLFTKGRRYYVYLLYIMYTLSRHYKNDELHLVLFNVFNIFNIRYVARRYCYLDTDELNMLLNGTYNPLIKLFNSYSAGTDFSRQNLTSVDVRF